MSSDWVKQRFLTRGNHDPQGTSDICRHSWLSQLEEHAADIQWREATDATKLPIIHRTVPRDQRLSGPKCHSFTHARTLNRSPRSFWEDSLLVKCEEGNKSSSCCSELSHYDIEASLRIKCGRQTQVSGDGSLPWGLLKRQTTFWKIILFYLLSTWSFHFIPYDINHQRQHIDIIISDKEYSLIHSTQQFLVKNMTEWKDF